MRYVVIHLARRKSGKIDERLVVTDKLPADLEESASVIIDKAKKKVLKATFEGVDMDLSYHSLLEYYRELYPDII